MFFFEFRLRNLPKKVGLDRLRLTPKPQTRGLGQQGAKMKAPQIWGVSVHCGIGFRV